MKKATELSLADFQFIASDDPLKFTTDYLDWRKAGQWAWDLYEPNMLGPAIPRVKLRRGGIERKVINLSSYNYLGFASNPEVIAASQQALNEYGTGACGSPILSGMSDLHRRLEEALAAFMGRESAMIYNSGFGGAMGAISGLLRKGDLAILDAKVHLSLIAGATLGRARMEFFDHNNPESLDQVLKQTKGKRRLVIVEGIYSMDGDMADLPAITEVAKRHGVGLFIDEAHSILACGDHGRGVTEHFGVEDKVDIVFATFSKGFAQLGGFIAGPKETLDYIRYYSHPYGFSCALPPSVVAGLLKVLEIYSRNHSLGKRLWDKAPFIRNRLMDLSFDRKYAFAKTHLLQSIGFTTCGDWLRKKLWDNTHYFRNRLLEMGMNLGDSTSQVVPIIIGSDRTALYEICHEMNQRGLFLPPVDFPSVPEDSLRYRAAVTAAHSKEDLDEALQIIEDTIVRRLR